MVEMFPLRRPVPNTTKIKPKKNFCSIGIASVKWPKAIMRAPINTAFWCPKILSAIHPPGMVYFMVVPGGWIADNILGHQKAVLIGAFIIALGHFTLAIPIEQSFFLGLTFVVLGTGLL